MLKKACSKGSTAREIYQMVDVHTVDSTEHKGILSLLVEMYDLATSAWHLL